MRNTVYAAQSHCHLSRFANLMELYEQNYLFTRLLIPDLKKLTVGEYVSQVDACLPLYLSVLEKEKYTTTVCLSYRFKERLPYPKQPNLIVRVYHDAGTTEAMSGLIHGQRYIKRSVRHLNESWRLNRFLYKWLRYCFYRGHLFSLQTLGFGKDK